MVNNTSNNNSRAGGCSKIFAVKQPREIRDAKTNTLKKSGLAGIFSASLELTKEGIISIVQEKNFEKLLVREKNEK